MLRKTDDAIRKRLRDHLAESCFVDISTIDDDASFITTGVLDSMAFLEMVAFLEWTFQIVINDDEMKPENMDSVSRVLGYVKRKWAEHPPK